MPSHSFYKPTYPTRYYQTEAPPNVVPGYTEDMKDKCHFNNSQQLKHTIRTTTNACKYPAPGEKWGADVKQLDGIKKITEDFKQLGFRKRPHEYSCRQKQYELSRTGIFATSYRSNNKHTFYQSFNNCYDKHKLTAAAH